MIGRRGFTLGMASMLAAGAARADDKPPTLKPKKKRRSDIPFTPLEKIPNHRQFMRDIVVALSDYAKKRKSEIRRAGAQRARASGQGDTRMEMGNAARSRQHR